MNGKIRLPNFDGGAGIFARAQAATERLLKETKLSRLPAIVRRGSACVVGDSKLDPHSEFQQLTKICADCLRRFAQVGVALDAHADWKAKAAKLAGWQGGNK